ncbi:MAG TPA: alpha/beta fold hydrolase [Candidatus Elarobacter sp.]|jgi:pimeloyl-ACP methyl ester carboxylesterase|nr:alpha/beta fold hydrolase [Candidatus Elarobacter sp.]
MNVTLHFIPDAGGGCHPELVEGSATIAVLEYEARRPRGVTLVAGHGYSSSKQNLDGLCAFLASHGFSVYSLDFPGHKLGASGGRLRDAAHLFEAMEAVVRFARERGARAVYTAGHSMGAATALCVAGRDPSIAGAVSIATGWGRPTVLEALASRGIVDLRSSYVVGPTLQELAEEWQPYLADALANLAGRPALFVAAERDAMIGASSVHELYARAAEPKSFVTVPSDHTFAADNSRTALLQWLNAMHPRVAAAEATVP